MGKTLYMECTSGISGDMTVAALLDLGADRKNLERVMESIPVHGFKVRIDRVKKSGLDCMDFSVLLDREFENHDHDMEYLHGHAGHDSHEDREGQETGDGHVLHHEHEEKQESGHDLHHEHEDGHGSHHEHRGLSDVLEIVEHTQMSDGAKEIAEKIFMILAEAEAKAHGTTVDKVHFHEVGAIDSIADVIAAAVCFDNLGITEVIIPRICEGRGTVRCAHGILPVPVPAVVNIMETYGLPVEFMDIDGEFVTPTGAAIAAAVKTSDKIRGEVKIIKTGMGAGKRTYERPSILRVMLIEEVLEKRKGTDTDLVYKLETNLDDCTGEALGFVMEALFRAGAKDVHYMPVYMKKNRPGWQLNVLCDKKDVASLEQIIFRETTTIGIRKIPYERTILSRRKGTVRTQHGEVEVKICGQGQTERIYPEYDSVAGISEQKGVPFWDVYTAVFCGERLF